jgi:hypothetical protein
LVHKFLVLVFIVIDVDFYFFDLQLFGITAGLVPVDLLTVQLVDVVFGFRVTHIFKRCFENEGPFLVKGRFFKDPEYPR